MSLINYRLRITLNDGRQMTGQMLAFDQHMNLVMAESEFVLLMAGIEMGTDEILRQNSGRVQKSQVEIKEAEGISTASQGRR